MRGAIRHQPESWKFAEKQANGQQLFTLKNEERIQDSR
jgi:hypothetical protein